MKLFETKKVEMFENLVKDKNQVITNLSLEKGKKVPEHKSDFTAVVVLIKGRINFCAGNNCQEIYLGSVIKMEPGEMLKIEALEDSDIIVIKSDLK